MTQQLGESDLRYLRKRNRIRKSIQNEKTVKDEAEFNCCKIQSPSAIEYFNKPA